MATGYALDLHVNPPRKDLAENLKAAEERRKELVGEPVVAPEFQRCLYCLRRVDNGVVFCDELCEEIAREEAEKLAKALGFKLQQETE